MGIRVWLGQPGWGWRLYGISWRDSWFIGFSRKALTGGEDGSR
jgi:hypothetical protein